MDDACAGKYPIVNNPFMRHTAAEMAVLEATRCEANVPEAKLLQQVAQFTYDATTRVDVLDMLWLRLRDTGSYPIVFNSLLVVEYLIRNGSTEVVNEMKGLVGELAELKVYVAPGQFQCFAPGLRQLASDLIILLQDNEAVRIARQRSSQKRLGICFGSNRSEEYGNKYTDKVRLTRDLFQVPLLNSHDT